MGTSAHNGFCQGKVLSRLPLPNAVLRHNGRAETGGSHAFQPQLEDSSAYPPAH